MVSLPEPCAFVRVQSWDPRASAPSSLQALGGGAWPSQAGECARGPLDVICTGPCDWLVLAGTDARITVLEALQRGCQGTSFRATDVSAALSRIRIECPQVRQILSQGCSIDLHPDAFGAGRAARTRLAGMVVILRCLQTFRFECIVTGSHAPYLEAWLNNISRNSV